MSAHSLLLKAAFYNYIVQWVTLLSSQHYTLLVAKFPSIARDYKRVGEHLDELSTDSLSVQLTAKQHKCLTVTSEGLTQQQTDKFDTIIFTSWTQEIGRSKISFSKDFQIMFQLLFFRQNRKKRILITVKIFRPLLSYAMDIMLFARG